MVVYSFYISVHIHSTVPGTKTVFGKIVSITSRSCTVSFLEREGIVGVTLTGKRQCN